VCRCCLTKADQRSLRGKHVPTNFVVGVWCVCVCVCVFVLAIPRLVISTPIADLEWYLLIHVLKHSNETVNF
jgi:hypothetical protein